MYATSQYPHASSYQPQNYGQYGAGGVAQGSWAPTAQVSQPTYQQPQQHKQYNNYSNRGPPSSTAGRIGSMTMMSENDDSGYSQRRTINDRDNGWPASDRMMSGKAPMAAQRPDSNFSQEPENRPPPGYYSQKMNQQRMPPTGSTGGGDLGSTARDHDNRISNDIIDHKKYVLFVLPDNAVCQEALTMVSNLNEVLVRNYQSIPATKRPQWLTGVPTLYSVVENQPYRGALCMNILKQLAAWELKGPNDLNLTSRMQLHSNRKDLEPESYISAGTHSVGVYVPDADDERKYVSGKLDEGDFEKYIERREKSGIYRPTGVGSAAGGIDQLLMQ